jgi:hypothetical protein
MPNPYAPSQVPTQTNAPPNLLRGGLAGLGFGLLSCDIIDLFGGDANALRGWYGGIPLLTIIGIFVGWMNSSRTTLWGCPLKSPTARLMWQSVGGFVLLEAAFPLFLTMAKPEIVLPWALTMAAAGSAYVVLPFFVDWNEASELMEEA